MSDLRDWLRGNNLGQYADAFEANDIDLDILPDLDDHDLEQLGLSLGNRRRLLKAIAARSSEAAPISSFDKPSSLDKSASAASLPSAEKSHAAEKSGPGDAERRQVTVMFADMVGSTALSAQLDPELLGGLIRRYQDAVAGAIGRYGGFVAKFMGDGVLAYFGFPRAFEDAAERAVRAGIGILSEVGAIELPDGTTVQARIGIATGLVVVGEIIGTGMAQERTIVGETPNLAARLQALASANCILVSESTQKLLGGLFELTHLGEHELKGFSRPVSAWQVCKETPIESRFAAIRAGGLPLIGRAHEVGLMRERWHLAQQGEGQILTVIGEAGIGKSHLIEALQQELAAEAHARINLQCSPYHSDSALYPVIQHLNRAAGLGPGDPPDARTEKLRALLAARHIANPAALPLLAELLSIPLTEPAPAASLAQRKAATLALTIEIMTRTSDNDPVLIVLEDAHWIDATTLEMMTRLADSISRARLLVVVSARPDFTPSWLSRPHATLITLGRLGRPECMQVVASVAAAHGLAADTVAAIIAKTDGVPLFVEELTRSVMESAGGDSVPATLKDSLMARLDRLGGAREVAQIAAVIGRQFTFALLDAVAGKDNDELEDMLAKLVAAGIVFPEERGLERSFNFKHALVRDAAYESLLLMRRRAWHGRVAQALEQRFGDLAAREPELLAYHFGEAGIPSLACDYRMCAGDQAVGRSAYAEAIAHFTAGLELAKTLPPQNGMRRQLDFWLKLGSASVVAHGLQSMQAETAYTKAAEIGEELGDRPASFQAKWGLWINANLRRKTALARDRANELVSLAQQSADRELLLEAYHCQLSTAHFRGDVRGVLEGSRHAISLYDVTQHRHLAHAFGGHDPCVCAHAQCGNSWQLSGEEHYARQQFTQAIALAEMLDHPNSLAHGLHSTGMGHQLGGDREAAYAAAHRAAALADKFGLPPWRASSLILVGWATANGAAAADAVRLIDTEIANATAAGPLPQYYLGLAAEVLLAAGRSADALGHLDRAIAGIDEAGIGIYLPEIYRLRGACLLALDRGNKAEARSAFATAADIAKRQGAVIFERRAQASLSEFTI
ncbi:adenylate/guanylate cyclase domain-containing protein [Bradyrhizobium sp. CB1650]|uniref:adenylate/guanylate cyclase domain-containing protein n=1 Tax=Bradyrhizobium sp. CB1650 TaxID=3039153 RepID=UPI002435B5E5|nr:adenylate/guanylate cyclase domain-containing protein [Bradyrhizobium sp. CB1650]WGD53200.1 adenylate/guanylate cyclase domain-containing protein [Bradyrhizobium sp. CB1650]